MAHLGVGGSGGVGDSFKKGPPRSFFVSSGTSYAEMSSRFGTDIIWNEPHRSKDERD